MGKNEPEQDRITVDLKDRRKKLLALRSDSAWEQLTIAGKIRTLIDDVFAVGYERLFGENNPAHGEPPAIAQLVELHWQAITEAGLDITGKRLLELRDGSRPSDSELLELALVVPYDAERLIEIRTRDFKNGQGAPNGQPAARL